ncbi:MAG: hypothetical protein K1X44_05840 [Alphaproteobacteria bacterium]|nr:hypothetical protein [Alphaproteobacteria bacterium]
MVKNNNIDRDDVITLLSGSDLRSIGQVNYIIDQVQKNKLPIADLFAAIFYSDEGVRMRAADALEKISAHNPLILKPFKKQILNKVSKITRQEVRWHLAQILPRLSLTKKERDTAFILLKEFLKDQSKIVRTFALQALTDIALQDPIYIQETINIVKNALQKGSPAMKSRAKKLIKQLEQ